MADLMSILQANSQPPQGWASVGQALAGLGGAGREDSYNRGMAKAAQLDQLVQTARFSREKAMEAERQRNQQTGLPDSLIAAGWDPNSARVAGAFAGSGLNPNEYAAARLSGQEYGNRDNIVAQALQGNLAGAGAYSMGLAKGPLEMTKIVDGTGYNPYLEADQQYHTTPVGQSTIGMRNASAASSYASANNSNASAARTRQATGIDAAKFGMERTGQWNPGGKGGGGEKPLPIGALKELLSVEDALSGTSVLNDIIQKNAGRIKDGTLKVGPADTLGANIRTSLNMSTDSDVARKEWEADLTKIVNESLRLNKGVQTEGDAQRAANELMAARDQKTVAAALQRLAGFNKAAVELQRRKQDLVNSNYGRPTNAVDAFGGAAPMQREGGVRPTTGQAPAIGTTRNGYRYTGGNPADRASWEKL